MTMAVRLQAVTASFKGRVDPAIVSDLTWEEIASLRTNMAGIVGLDLPPEKLGQAVEATSPKLAADLRSRNPKEIADYITLVIAFLELMLQIYQIASGVTPVQVTQIINQVETTVINQTTVINSPLPPPAPPSADPPSATPLPPTDEATGDQPGP